MKKRIFIVILSILCVVFLCTSCKKSIVLNEKLSELRNDILIGENSDFRIVAVTGIRENPFNIDGISQKEKIDFTIITVIPIDYTSAKSYDYSVIISETEYKGKLTAHPFNQTYSVEINVATNQPSINVNISGVELTLNSVKNESFIDEEKAHSVAHSRLKAKIDEKSKQAEYEFFVRLIENPINSSGGYFWYVAYVFTDDTVFAALIDPVTVEIVAIKE